MPAAEAKKNLQAFTLSMEEVLTGMARELRPSRRTARRIFENEAYRQIIAGNVPATLSEFSTQLAAWFKDTYPAAPVPPASFIEAAIHDTWHRRHEIIGSEL